MRTATAQERHRAHHNRQGGCCVVYLLGRARLVGLLGAMAAAGCSGALPRPPAAQVSADDYVAVPFAPRVPPVEFIPPSPAKNAVWVDGSWEWAGNRYGWRYGSWVVPPAGVRRAHWTVVRRDVDGQLFFAPATWKDASGKVVADRSFWNALGPAARARSRPGAPPPPTARPGPAKEPEREQAPSPVPVDDALEDEGE